MTQKPKRHDRRERDENAVLVYPNWYVQELFGYTHPGSVRKLMSRHGKLAVVGYLAEDVEALLKTYDPSLAWDRSPWPPKSSETPRGRGVKR